MKKLALVLVLISLLTLGLSSLTAHAAPPKIEDYFPQIAVPAEDQKLKSSINAFFVGINEITDPVGQWNWGAVFNDKPGCWPIYQQINPLDCNLKALCTGYNPDDFKGATHIRQLVFADYFTQSGQGEGGRHNPEKKREDFEQLTIIYSTDTENWKSVGFTVAYHTERTEFVDRQGAEHTIDTYWHLIFDEPVPVTECAWIGIHSSEAKAWDAQDHVPTLGIAIHADFAYLIADTGSAPELIYPESDTTAAPTEAPAAEAPVTEGATEAPATDVATDDLVTEPAVDNGGMPAWVYVVIAVAVVAVVVVVVIVAKKKK
jgi:hypothetical protein